MIPEYEGWRTVPAHLYTRTQLADLDLPRQPGGPVRAYVTAEGQVRRRETYELYDARESAPSPASARQLESAAARRKPGAFACQDCGAHTERTAIRIHGRAGERRLVCLACRHIAAMREFQAKLAVLRADNARSAAAWLAEDTAAVLQVDVLTPPPADSGRRRPAVAYSAAAFTPSGRELLSLGIRLRRSRHELVPEGSLDIGDAIPVLRGVLDDRALITWQFNDLYPIAAALLPEDAAASEIAGYWRHRDISYLNHLVAQWRGELDPDSGQLRGARHPGRADLMALLIRRMAADHTPEAAS